jgi:hypothetical protein
MTIETHYSLNQLATVLSALDGQRRNPNTKRNALAAIGRSAKPLELTAEEVLAAADGLLDGRVSAADFLKSLRDEPFEAPAEPQNATQTTEPTEAISMAGPSMQSPKTRPNTTQALMIELLRRPEGATVEQIAGETGWQHHYADARIMPR